MKRVFWSRLVVSFSVLAFATASYAGDDNDAAVTKFVMEQIQTRLEIEVTAIDGPVQSQVFSCTFFHAKPWLTHEDGSKESWSNYLLVQNGDKIAIMERPDQPKKEKPQLLACLNDSFALTSDSDAMLLLNSIQGIIDEDDSGDERSVVKTANGWQLITGKFFDDNKGYIVETDTAGKVIDITYVYELPTT